MKTINFRNITHTPDPYSKAHGLFQCDDGSLVILGVVPKEKADAFFEKFRELPPAMADAVAPMLNALKSMGAEVEQGQRMRRVLQQEKTNGTNELPVQNGGDTAVHSEGPTVQAGTGGSADAGNAAGVSG